MRIQAMQNKRARRLLAAVVTVLLAVMLVGMQTVASFAASAPPETQCDGVLLYDQKTGEVLYEKNCRSRVNRFHWYTDA